MRVCKESFSSSSDDHLFDPGLYEYEEEQIDDGPKLGVVQMAQLLDQFREEVGSIFQHDEVAKRIIDTVVVPMAVNNYLGSADRYKDISSAIQSLKKEISAGGKIGGDTISCK